LDNLEQKLSPGMQQYLKMKEDYPDAFLLFRMGDFYELFYEDAIKAAKILELTLTSRNKNAEIPIPMAGVPFHAVQNYIDVLVEQGHKVAIAEQVEDSTLTKGVVKREVVQVITPGTIASNQEASAKENNYLTALVFSDSKFGFAYTDLSTGELKVSILESVEDVVNEATGLNTKEMVLGSAIPENLKEKLKNHLHLMFSEQLTVQENAEFSFLTQDLVEDLEIEVSKKLLAYLSATQKRSLNYLQKFVTYRVENFLKLDYAAKYNLELMRALKTRKKTGSLLWLMDKTETAMGSRLLRQWLDRPLISEAEINWRQDMVESLLANFFERADLQNLLKGVYDLERLSARVCLQTIKPRELLQLSNSLAQIPKLQAILENINLGEFNTLLNELNPDEELQDLINRAISEDAPLTTKEGGIVKSGYNEELDQYRKASTEGSQWILDLEQKERKLTGIKNLRIDYNRKDGYYFHVTKANLEMVPEDRYFRKVTLKNSERYGTGELEKLQSTILEATEKSAALEYELFLAVRTAAQEHVTRLQRLAKSVSQLDVLLSFAQIAENYNYVRPKLVAQGAVIKVTDGRHPVVEKVLGCGEYIANSIEMDEDTSMFLITGPNMSGKSTYMRQLALISIMAQLGSFVPAKEAVLPIFDRIFTRIGASDDLISGQSTFMVEMMEANSALKLASKQSLILFDELGRGTATYDGMALAQAIIEYVNKNIGAKTLFSTHYHELTSMDEDLSGLKNIHVGAIEQDGDLVFLHKMMEGAADKSYGIHVAKIAGLPVDLLNRATKILAKLEKDAVNCQSAKPLNSNVLEKDIKDVHQTSLFSKGISQESEIVTKLKNLDVFKMSPLTALNTLFEMKKQIEESV